MIKLKDFKRLLGLKTNEINGGVAVELDVPAIHTKKQVVRKKQKKDSGIKS